MLLRAFAEQESWYEKFKKWWCYYAFNAYRFVQNSGFTDLLKLELSWAEKQGGT